MDLIARTYKEEYRQGHTIQRSIDFVAGHHPKDDLFHAYV